MGELTVDSNKLIASVLMYMRYSSRTGCIQTSLKKAYEESVHKVRLKKAIRICYLTGKSGLLCLSLEVLL